MLLLRSCLIDGFCWKSGKVFSTHAMCKTGSWTKAFSLIENPVFLLFLVPLCRIVQKFTRSQSFLFVKNKDNWNFPWNTEIACKIFLEERKLYSNFNEKHFFFYNATLDMEIFLLGALHAKQVSNLLQWADHHHNYNTKYFHFLV